MAKPVTIKLEDASGAPAAGVNVKVTDCIDLDSSPIGTATFLVTADNFTVTIEGADVWTGALDSVGSEVSFVNNGGSWAAK